MFGKDEFLYDRNGMKIGRKPGDGPEIHYYDGRDVLMTGIQRQVQELTEGPAETPHGPPEKTQSSSGLLEFAEELVELERRRAKLLELRDEFIRKLQAL